MMWSGWDPHDGINVLKGRTPESLFSLSFFASFEGTTRRCNHLQSRKRTFSSEFNRVGTLTLDFQKCEKMNFYCFSHPGCVILLWQPKLINMPPYPLQFATHILFEHVSSSVFILLIFFFLLLLHLSHNILLRFLYMNIPPAC